MKSDLSAKNLLLLGLAFYFASIIFNNMPDSTVKIVGGAFALLGLLLLLFALARWAQTRNS